MEAFFAVCPCPILGVTGSDGKTTTASVIAELLKAEGRRVAGGNIGRPLLADAEQMTPDDLAVLELSSFQLMDMPYSPQVAVLTNLAPNHLDVHRDMAEYIASKEKYFTCTKARGTPPSSTPTTPSRRDAPEAARRSDVRVCSRGRRAVADGVRCAAARSGCAMRQGGDRWQTSAFPACTMWKTIWQPLAVDGLVPG